MKTKKQKNVRRILVLSAIAICATVFCAVRYLPLHGEEAIYTAVIRLHVRADSDSAEDQARKLSVRDSVLTYTQDLLAGVTTRAEAAECLQAHTQELKTIARQTLQAQGCTDEVQIVLGQENYPIRNYESFCFPAGEYLSLQVIIGSGEGKNWWCVLFPPCCKAAASVTQKELEEEFIAVGLTKDQYRMITQTEETKYKLRFRILEVIEEWFQ